MHRGVLGACVAATLAALGAIVPAASKTTSTLPPGKSDEAVLGRARMLASHGEPRLALSTLRAHEFDRDDREASRLTVSLLAELGQTATAESLLTTGPRRAEDASARFTTQLVRARLLLDAKRYPASLAALASIDTVASPYAGYRDLVMAQALIATGDRETAIGVLERARKHAPEAIFDEVDQRRIELYRALGRTREALAAAIDAAGEDGDADARRRVLAIRFDLADETGEVLVAQDAAQNLFDQHRRSEEARDCARAIAQHAHRDRFESPVLLSCASTLHAHSQRDALRVVLRDLDKRTLSPAQNEELRLLWGEYHYLSGDYSRAIALARPSYADTGLRRRSMLLMARSYKRVGRSADSATTYEAYARAYPNDVLAAEALYTAAALYEQIDRDADRVRVLDELRHAYPSSFHGWAASMARARELEAGGRHDDATAIFDQWLTRSRRTDEAALFYSSRQRRAAGDAAGSDALLAELRAVNPYSFYARPDMLLPGTRQARTGPLDSWLVDATRKRDAAIERIEARVAKAERTRAGTEAAGALERGRFFLSVGFRDWAEQELDVARRRLGDSPADALALARLFDENAMPWRSVRLYERTRGSIPWKERREFADDFRYLTHPVPFPVQVMTAAQREGIAPNVIYGMMREESCFDTDVVSRAGAVGLMQLMPQTAREIAHRLDLEPGAGDRLGDPVVNVSIGSWYAADLLREGDGSVVWMLAAYNAGPRAARRWIDAGTSGEAAIDAVESIDYKETRGYVKRVVESANVYQALYFEGAPATSGPR